MDPTFAHSISYVSSIAQVVPRHAGNDLLNAQPHRWIQIIHPQVERDAPSFIGVGANFRHIWILSRRPDAANVANVGRIRNVPTGLFHRYGDAGDLDGYAADGVAAGEVQSLPVVAAEAQVGGGWLPVDYDTQRLAARVHDV